jgi:hypothetical protein
MSGYVCSIKPLKLINSGKIDQTRAYIASSAFKRVLRLGVPTTVATCISWYLCQIGAYSMTYSLPDDCWLNFHSARPDENWDTAIKELGKAIVCLCFDRANGSYILGLMMGRFGVRIGIGLK